VLALIRSYRERGLQTPFNAEVLGKAGVTESLVPRTLNSLRGLELIDEAGEPTAALLALRKASSADFAAKLADVVRGVYAEVFQFVDPAKDDVVRVGDAFRDFEPLGQRARMVTLFLGLSEAAGIIPEGTVRKAAPSSTRPKVAPRNSAIRSPAASGKRGPSVGPTANVRTAEGGFIPPALMGLLASLPIDGGGWTQDRRDKFVKTFESVLDFMVPIRDGGGDEQDEADDAE
jgi:hypothetical protein